MWMEMIPKVWKDRNDNEDAAWGLRVDNLDAEEDSDDNNMDGDSGGVEGDTADAEKDNAPSFLAPPQAQNKPPAHPEPRPPPVSRSIFLATPPVTCP
jgi:hypothetical protein